MPLITVVDYGMGNLRSVSKALEALGAEVRVSSDPKQVAGAAKLILPGVGAFPSAMAELITRGLAGPIKSAVTSGTPYLGICLGLQLLFETSDEGGAEQAGLGLLRGRVLRFPVNGAVELKIPHMGWNQVERPLSISERPGDCPLLSGIPDRSFFYFVHSYYAAPADRSIVALETDYGGRFVSMVQQGNIYATQFHPEKSQALGLQLLKNFIAL